MTKRFRAFGAALDVMTTDLASRLDAVLGAPPETVTELDGGQVGTVYRVTLPDDRTLVAKVGTTPLSVEADMLRFLAAETDLPVPEVHHASDDLLVMEYVEGWGEVTPAVERDAAEHLAALHDVTAEAHGFAFDTLSGSLTQRNPWTDSWVAFFRDQRLLPVAEIASREGGLTDGDHDRVRDLAADLEELLTEPRAPSLLHGDVWAGNLVVDADRDRVAAFLDPALYFGHAEVDLAYVDWTETGGEPFFERYEDRRGIEDGFFERRRHAYAVHPILEHLWYFGAEYRPALDDRLTRLGY